MSRDLGGRKDKWLLCLQCTEGDGVWTKIRQEWDEAGSP